MLNEAVRAMLAKAEPTLSDVWVSAPLTNISVAYYQQAKAFVFHQAFPNVPVMNSAGKYCVWDKGDLMRSVAQVRAPGTPTVSMGAALDWADYACEVYGVNWPVADMMRANQHSVINLDRAATNNVTQQMLMLQEIYWTAVFFVTGAWTNESTPSPLWGASNDHPIKDIRDRMDERHAATGFRPNTLILGPKTYSGLCYSSDVLTRIQYSERGIVTTELIRAMLDLDRVLIAYGVQNTAAKGATATPDFIAGNHALLCYAAPSPALETPSAGYTISWNGYIGAAENGYRIKRFRNEDIASWKVEAEAGFVHKKVCDDCGHFFYNAV